MIPRFPKGLTHPMLVGEGAFSSVYRVRQNSLDRWVAVKILKEKRAEKRAGQLREAQTQARVEAACVPEVFDVFEWKKQVFIVMQWIRGVSLSELIKSGLTGPDKLRLSEGIIVAVAALHARGYVHRDIKPENIQISPKDGIYLLDFGLSRDPKISTRTAVNVVKGTPAYMAPELWLQKKEVDYFRADIFAVGRVLKWLLTSEPFEAFVGKLVNEDPDARPANGEALVEMWREISAAAADTPDWERLAGPLVSRTLSSQLFAASKKLLHKHREEEAYWLLEECLEEDPDNMEALRLMEVFSRTRRRWFQRPWAGVSAAAIATILVGGGFYIGMEKGRTETRVTLQYSKSAADHELLTQSKQAAVGIGKLLPLRSDSVGTRSLYGILRVASYPNQGRLYADDQPLDRGRFESGWRINFGRHVISWKDLSGMLLWKEKINMLPFQTKVIHIPSERLRFGERKDGP